MAELKCKGGSTASPFDSNSIAEELVHADGDLARLRFLDFRNVDFQNSLAIGGLDAVLLDGLPTDTMIDGEVVAIDADGRMSFNALHRNIGCLGSSDT